MWISKPYVNRFRGVEQEDKWYGYLLCKISLHRWSYIREGSRHKYCTRFKCEAYKYK